MRATLKWLGLSCEPVRVWVASYPRSGNTLTLLTLRDVFGIGRIAAVYSDSAQWSFVRDPERIPPRVEWHPPAELLRLPPEGFLEALRERDETFFVKTRMPAMADEPEPAL